MNPLKTLTTLGQAVWLDAIRRGMLHNGCLDRLICEDGLSGVTSNPSIFEKAISGSHDYADAIAAAAHHRALDDEALYEHLAIADIQAAADRLQALYDSSGKRDGYVSLEVAPSLANDTEGTCAAARRLWKAVDRPNLMIKVPGTRAGLDAIEQLLAEGLNVNVTLLFSLNRYAEVAERYLRGLERRREAGHPIGDCASVASFFVSRIDTAVDSAIDARLDEYVAPVEKPFIDAVQNASATGDPGNANAPAQRPLLDALRGKAAVASARLAYQHWKSVFRSARWRSLEAAGARPQRLLWASTSTKNPAYSDVLYLESLIGPDTVSTVPPATLDAYRDHGRPRLTLEDGLDGAASALADLQRFGIDLEAIANSLLQHGLAQFEQAYARLIESVAERRNQAVAAPVDRQTLHLPAVLSARVNKLLLTWRSERKSERLWARDANLWTGRGENQWLDWLDIVPMQLSRLAELQRIGHQFQGRYFRHLVVLGMGGSSLGAEVIGQVLGHAPEHPQLIVLDSTDPQQIRNVEQRIDLERTLFAVASKSGTTLEPNLLADYFYERLAHRLDRSRAARHFIVITDPDSPLQRLADARNYRAVYHGRRGIGGRYAALSNFGLIPAALTGVDLERLLQRSAIMVEACAAATPAEHNPAVMLGLTLGAARQAGWDKITFIATAGIAPLGAWLEQLLGESTGKYGTGLLPVYDEPPGDPQSYGQDRLFVYLRLTGEAEAKQDEMAQQLIDAGHPLVRIDLVDRYDLGQEFFRWQFTSAVAGSVMHLNPFDQPDVEGAKLAARRIAGAIGQDALEPPAPQASSRHLAAYAGPAYWSVLRVTAGQHADLQDLLTAHLNQLRTGDYFALLAYLDREDPAIAEQLQRIRELLRKRHGNATCLGYGPRYLHTTGQVFKGGPDTGVLLMITRDSDDTLAPPGGRPGFAETEMAQALADQQELEARGRRVLRIHLSGDVETALAQLVRLVKTTGGNSPVNIHQTQAAGVVI